MQPPTACGVAVPELHLSGSAAFGGVLRSHAEMTFVEADIQERFQLTFDFRNYYTTGLLMYVTNELQNDLIGLQIEGGVVELLYWYRGALKILRSSVTVTDGLWHSVTVCFNYFSRLQICVYSSLGVLYISVCSRRFNCVRSTRQSSCVLTMRLQCQMVLLLAWTSLLHFTSAACLACLHLVKALL